MLHITFPAAPSSPGLSSTSFPNSSVLLSWLPPSDDPLCVDHYLANVTSQYSTTVVTTHSTSLLMGPLEPGEYVFSVAGVDALNRTGDYGRTIVSIEGNQSGKNARIIIYLQILCFSIPTNSIGIHTLSLQCICNCTITILSSVCDSHPYKRNSHQRYLDTCKERMLSVLYNIV